MPSWEYHRRQKQLVTTKASTPDYDASYCKVMGCPYPARAAGTDGFDSRFCRQHHEHRQRHGSPYQGTYSATILNPYRQAALSWLLDHADDIWVKDALGRVSGLYRKAGPHQEAFRLTGLKPRERAWAHWARMRKHEVNPVLPVAAWVAVEMVIANDPQAVATKEFKQVQAAKLIHRMASGTHKQWDQAARSVAASGAAVQVASDRGSVPQVKELHVFPRSRGRVLRHIGGDLDQATELLVDHCLPDVQAFKTQRDIEFPGRFTGRPHSRHLGGRKRQRKGG